LNIWPVKFEVSTAAITLFNLNAFCGAVFSLLGEKDVQLMALTSSCPSAQGQHHLGMGI
jgi:hypothetical protein